MRHQIAHTSTPAGVGIASELLGAPWRAPSVSGPSTASAQPTFWVLATTPTCRVRVIKVAAELFVNPRCILVGLSSP